MKRIFSLACFILCMSIHLFAQGVAFQKITFENALSTAKTQNKLIFIDFYTDWCGPCKNIAKNVFPQKSVGDFFNQHFICLKLNAEKEGAAYAKRYQVSAYPTMLYLNAQGEVMHKRVGGGDAASILEDAKTACNSLHNPNNLVNLKKRYEAEKNDEEFLKLYIDVMKQGGENYREVLEQFLTVQKGIPANSSKMFELLIENNDKLLVGGMAERILTENMAEYLDIATDSEVKQLNDCLPKLLRNTRSLGEKEGNPEIFATFLRSWKAHPEVHRPFEEEKAYEADLYFLQRDDKQYKETVIAFLNDLMDRYPVDQVKAADKAHYEDYCKKNPAIGAMAEMFKRANKDLRAGINTRHVLKQASRMIRLAKKKDFKSLEQWGAYAKQLSPDDIQVDNFISNVMYKKGDKKGAIALKRQLIEKDGPKGRFVQHFQHELKRMEEGTMFK